VSALPAAVARLLAERGERVAAARRVPGGANSEAWEVTTDAGPRYLAKRYPPAEAGAPDRLATEFGAFSFLRSQGVAAVPSPAFAAAAERVALYGFVEGRRVGPGEVGPAEVRQAAALLRALHALRGAPGTERLPAAREACFSINAHVALVRARFLRLRTAAGEEDGLTRWLDRELAPHLERVEAWVAAACGRAGIDPAAELPPGARTLSPSDFGFHNAIRRPDGALVFVDFEYFGWDDPAKTVADFFLQPAVPVPPGLRPGFFEEVSPLYDPGAHLAGRLPPVYVLLAVKWCLIALNVFLRPRGGADGAARREAQAARARAQLERARSERDARAFTNARAFQ